MPRKVDEGEFYLEIISPSFAILTIAVPAEMIAEVHSSRVLVYTWRNREAWRGYKYPIRGSNLGGSRERNRSSSRPLVLP